MFVGHGLLAFALVALAGRRVGWDREHVLTVALLAGAFATLPDVDIVYAPVGLLGGVSGVFAASDAFWQTGNVVHRVITHSLPVGLVAAVAFGLWAAQSDASIATSLRGRIVSSVLALVLLGCLITAATLATGGLGGIIMTVFVIAGLAITTVAMRYGVGSKPIVATALVGLLTHPFGDLLTGSPPPMLYPFEVTVITERIALHPDPTIHLVGAFLFELSMIWLAGYAYFQFHERQLRDYVSPRAATGLGYAGAALLLPAPTLDASAHFVFSALAVGFVGSVGVKPAAVDSVRHVIRSPKSATLGERVENWRTDLTPVGVADVHTAGVTGLTAVTFAVLSYGLAYVLVL